MAGEHDLITTRGAVLTRAKEVTFMGHPKGLFYLAFTEAWERFSYYGMTALLALYMVNQLLLPGHVEHIGGFAGFRAALESVAGPLSTQALASQIFGLYSGFVYFTPLLGGMIADRWIGQRNAVVIGALSMSAGHIAMTFDQSFLIALLLLVIGSGFLKGNISAQVGALYPAEDEVQRTRGFVIFSTAINIGAVVGPLLCGFLAQAYGWHYGFGIAAIFMLLGLATYLYGYRYLPARVARRQFEGTRLTAVERRTVFALIAVMGIAFLYYWPSLLALVSRAAPAKVNATMMGLTFMSLFIANNLIGWLGGFYEKMGPTGFWAMHAVIAAGGGLLVLLFGRRLDRT